MTNFEKFIEVFGHEPETGCPFVCYNDCPYYESDRSCRIGEFWDAEWKALEQKPSGDVISRQAVLDIDFKRIILTTAKPAEMIKQKVKVLPPVNPQEPKTAHWINYLCRVTNERWYACSHCRSEVKSKTDYCPNCGAKMEEQE